MLNVWYRTAMVESHAPRHSRGAACFPFWDRGRIRWREDFRTHVPHGERNVAMRCWHNDSPKHGCAAHRRLLVLAACLATWVNNGGMSWRAPRVVLVAVVLGAVFSMHIHGPVPVVQEHSNCISACACVFDQCNVVVRASGWACKRA